MLSATFAPADVAARWDCRVEKVLALIAAGELVAVNTAVRTKAAVTTPKPRWRITKDALDDFERSRSTSPKPKQTPVTPKHRRVATPIHEFF